MQEDVLGAAMQRVGVLSELPALLAGMGVDARVCAAGTRIDPAALRPDDRVPFTAMLRFLAQSVERSGCAHLGLVIGLRFRLAHQGLIGRLMACAPTLRQALTDFVTLQPGYSTGAVVYLMRQGEELALGYGLNVGPDPGCRPLYDGVMVIGLRMVDELTGGRMRPQEVHFSYRQSADSVPCARLLGVPVRFGQPRTCLILDATALAMCLPGADADRRREIGGEVEVAL